MKLKNKKTGEIMEVITGDTFEQGGVLIRSLKKNPQIVRYYNSLAELNAEWEDYEEPKNFWYIDDFMIMCGQEDEFTTPDLGSFMKKDIEKLKAIGNYFETKEEAEKSVEKLKAWKWLKDKGFKFDKWFTRVEGGIQINMEYPKYDGIHAEDKADLDLLFGGEE